MEIRNMNQQDQIMIQEAKIRNQNYSISWLASVYHQDILVCIKSSWLSYDKFKTKLEEHGNQQSYQDREIFWQTVTKQTSVQVLTSTIKPPVDVILLPITKKEILFPKDEKECEKLQKTIKGIIKFTKKREAPLLSFYATECFSFNNDSLPVSNEEIVAEYGIENLRYPVTAAMLGKNICVQIPRKAKCDPYITKKLNNKYNLIISEE